MFGFGNRNKGEDAIPLIINAGKDVSAWFMHEDTLQWEHANLWTAMCGTIPAFACVIVHEIHKSGEKTLSLNQRDFFKSIENYLFKVYKLDADSFVMPIRTCLPLLYERQEVCKDFGVTEDTLVTMAMIMGIIFPNRLRRYQRDWVAGFSSNSIHAPAEYAAMRLAADLTGIETPESLVGHNATDLGIMSYGSALTPLLEFASAYLHNT